MNAKLIRKNLISNYPGAVLYGLLFNITLLLDSIIAGLTLGPTGIAAVALGVPGYGVLAAVMYSFIHGSGLRMIWAKGRADQAGFHRDFNGGATLVTISGLAFTVLIFLFADKLVLICGGDMVDAPIRESAVVYLQACAPMLLMAALGMTLQEVMNVFGFQTARAALSAVNVGVNLIVSVLCVSILPADMKLAGLGIGTSAAGLCQFIAGFIILRILKVRLGFRPMILRFKEILDTARSGFPAAADYFAENIIMGIQNNLILAGFPGNAMIFPTAEVVCNISYIASGAIKGMAIAAEPLFGVFYAEKDLNSIKSVWKQGWVMGIVMSLIWALIFYVSLPALSALCGMTLSQDISRGVILCLIFAPVMHTVYMFTLYYESTKRFAVSIAFAIVPDSCLYVIMMALLIPVLGKDGIWLAITGNQVVGLILLLPPVMLIGSKAGDKRERLLLLPEQFYSGSLLADFEVRGEEIERLREPLQIALQDPNAAEVVMNCAEELVSDIRRISKYIHINLTDRGDTTELSVRSLGRPEDLSLSEYEKAIACCGGTLTLTYVYKMNIVNIRFNIIQERNPPSTTGGGMNCFHERSEKKKR